MGRQCYLLSACVFITALTALNGAAADEVRGISREYQKIALEDHSSPIVVGSSARSDAAPAAPAETQADGQVQQTNPASKSKSHRKVCVHGEWVSASEFNPFSPACTYVSY
jgi:hypothetical protein